MTSRKAKTQHAFKGFGTLKQPRLWLEIVYLDSAKPSTFKRLNCTDEAAQGKIDKLLQDNAIDCCILLKGSADIENIKKGDVLLMGERDN
jgi:hypothetical protein